MHILQYMLCTSNPLYVSRNDCHILYSSSLTVQSAERTQTLQTADITQSDCLKFKQFLLKNFINVGNVQLIQKC